MPSLTQTEAEARSALVTVERYDVSVDLTSLPTGPEVRCVSTITFTSARPGASTFVDCVAEVREATLNGVALGPAADGRLALPALAAHNVLVVSSVQADTASRTGVAREVDPSDDEVYVWMSFEPDECRYVWACFDQPDQKCPHAITVDAPAAWRVTSNSGVADVEDAPDGRDEVRRWAFPDTPALATYNLVVNAGPFHEVRREAGGHDLGLLSRRSLAAVLDRDADDLFTVTEQGLEFFGRVFEMPFPQRVYDQVFVPGMGGAMENYGCVTWSDAFLHRSAPTPGEREYTALVLLHEMAHMWFGNIVTMRWWDDLWLNEAFAEFAAHWAAAEATEHTDVWAALLAGWKREAYEADQGPGSHPIHQAITDTAQAMSIFDLITYPKGASMLRQLMAYVGEDVFAAGMAAYFAEHAWGSTTLQDLVDAQSRASGRDLDPWRDGWLSTAGTDRMVLEAGPPGPVLVGRGPAGPPRPQRLRVGAYRRPADGREPLERVALAEVEVSGERTPLDLPPADVYLVNDEDLSFVTSRPDAATRDALFADAARLPTAIARAVAVATAWDMLFTGEATAAEIVPALCAAVLAETAPSVVEPHLGLALAAADDWSPDADRDRLLDQVTACARELATRPEAHEVAVRSLARTVRDPAELSQLLADAAGTGPDLQWRLLTRAASLGQDVSADVARLLADDPDPDAWSRALTVRAATPDVGAKAEGWARLGEARDVPYGVLRQLAQAFWARGQEQVLDGYADAYLGLLDGLDRGGMIPALAYTTALFPTVGIHASYVDRVVAASASAPPVVGKTAIERADVVRRMLLSRAGGSEGRGTSRSRPD